MEFILPRPYYPLRWNEIHREIIRQAGMETVTDAEPDCFNVPGPVHKTGYSVPFHKYKAANIPEIPKASKVDSTNVDIISAKLFGDLVANANTSNLPFIRKSHSGNRFAYENLKSGSNLKRNKFDPEPERILMRQLETRQIMADVHGQIEQTRLDELDKLEVETKKHIWLYS